MKKIICLVVLLCCLLGLSIMAYADDTDTVKTDQPHDRVITFVDPDAAEEQDSGEENAEKENLRIYTGKSVVLQTTVEKLEDSAPDSTVLSWSSSDDSIATVKNGTVTGIAKGTVTITCAAEDNEQVFAEKEIDVILPVNSVEMTESKVTALIFEDREDNGVQLEAKVLPEDAFCQDLVWTSSNEAVATVDDNGYVTALIPGTAVITATSPDEYSAGSRKAVCTVTVLQAASSVELDNEELVLNLGATLTLKATVKPDNTSNKSVVWESSAPDVVTVSNGYIRAAACGEAVITATAADESGAATECKVTVIQMVTSVTMDGAAKTVTLGKDEETTLKAIVAPENATNKALSWTSSDEAVVTVTEDGVLYGVDAGSATITCSATDGSDKSVSVEVTVPRSVSGVNVSENNAELYVGDRLALSATVVPEDASDKRVEWKSSDETVAKVDQSGNVTAVGGGKAKITCQALDGSEAADSCEIRVIIATQRVVLDETKATLLVGASEEMAVKQLNFSVEPADAEFQNVLWSSSDDKVAAVDENGMVTGVAPGTAVITAATEDPRGTDRVKAVATITVGNAVQEISINGVEGDRIAKGTSLVLKAGLTPENVFNPKVTWESSDDSVIVIDANGYLRAVGVGTATITCTATDGSGVSKSVNYTVYQSVTSIKLKTNKLSAAGSSVTFEGGEEIIVTAEVLPEDATLKDVKWSVDDDSIAEIKTYGPYATVSGINPGNVRVTATAIDGSDKSAYVDLTIEPLVPLTVEAISREVNNGNRMTLTVHNNCKKTTIKNFDFTIEMYDYTGKELVTSGGYSIGSDETISPNSSRGIKRTFNGFTYVHEVSVTITGVKLADGSFYEIPTWAQREVTFYF